MTKTTSPRDRRLGWFVVAVFVLQGFLLFGYRFFEERVDDPTASWVQPFINEVTGAIGGLLLFPIVYWLCARFRLARPNLWKALVAHAVAMPVLSIVHTLMNWAFRTGLYPAFGVEGGYGDLRVRFAQEFFNDVWGYALMLVVIYGYLYVRDARERELDTVRLEAELGRARLEELRARLHPHFLFNTLNAISAHVGDDPHGAERMIDRLGALLRRSLSASAAQETSVEEEVETLELYLGIMRDRMGDRLHASLDVDDEVLDATIPTLLLQPIVENAIEHGIGPRASGGRVVLRIAREDDRLVVAIDDDGVGLGPEPEAALRAGFGLSSTVERLRHLYGTRGRLSLEPLPEGTRVRVEIPFVRRGGQAPAAAGDAEVPG